MQNFHDFSRPTLTAEPLPARFFPWIGHGLKVVLMWLARSRQRRHLAKLDDAQRRDIGLTSRDIQREIDKPFWRS